MLNDAGERRRIDALAAELGTVGFQRAVIIERDHWWNVRPRVRDGMHRSIAAMRLGIPVLVRYGYQTDTPFDPGDVVRGDLAQ